MFGKLLFPTDFSEKSRHALDVVEKMVDTGTKTVVLVHCVDKREITTMAEMEGFSSLRYTSIVEEVRDELHKRAERQLAPIARELKDSGFAVEERLVEGIPFQEILRISEKENVDMIVLGSTGKGLISEIVLGSTSEKVVREARYPVLIVK